MCGRVDEDVSTINEVTKIMAKGLLLGAGFSVDLGMPLASEFSDTLFSFFHSRKMIYLINNMRGHRPYSNDRTLCDETLDKFIEIYNEFLNSNNKNYEQLFKIIENLSLFSGVEQETRNYFLRWLRDIINELFLIYQRETYVYYLLNRDKYKWFLDEFSKDELWIFTLNHDILVEMLCLDYNVPLREGYSYTVQIPQSNLELKNVFEFGCVDATEKDVNNLHYLTKSKGINILKIHGGLNEYFQGDEKSGRYRLFFSTNNCRNSLEYLNKLEQFIHEPHYYINGCKPNIGGEICVSNFDGIMQFMKPSILTGSKKYHTTLSNHQHEEKIELFSSGLEKIDELYIIGYSFGDKHINHRISHAMHLNDKLKVTIVNPTYAKQEIFEPFDYNMRVRYCHTTFPIWADYEKKGEWDLDFRRKIEEMTSNVRKPMIEAIKENLLKSSKQNK